MYRLRIAEELVKIAEDLVFADSNYIYDPDHKKHPGGGYHKTEKGWSKLKEEMDNRKTRMTNQQIQLDDKSKSDNVYVRKSVANNSLTSRETLDRLSKDKHGDVRKNVALNKNTSQKTLDRLSKDTDWGVRMGVARNPRTSESTLSKLVNDEVESVAEEASKQLNKRKKHSVKKTEKKDNNKSKYNADYFKKTRSFDKDFEHTLWSKNAPHDFFENAIKYGDSGHKWEIANYYHTPSDILDKLAFDKDESVRYKAIENGNTSGKTLTKVFNAESNKKNPSNDIYEAIGKHKNAPSKILSYLSSHPNKDV